MEEWREERRKWEEERREDKRRREGMEKRLERMEERDGRVEELIGRIEKWEREKEGRGSMERREGGELEDCWVRMRKIELK